MFEKCKAMSTIDGVDMFPCGKTATYMFAENLPVCAAHAFLESGLIKRELTRIADGQKFCRFAAGKNGYECHYSGNCKWKAKLDHCHICTIPDSASPEPTDDAEVAVVHDK